MRLFTSAAVAASFGAAGVAVADHHEAEAERCFDKATLTYYDCPVEPAPVMAPPNWTGPYIGLHAGYFGPSFGGQYNDGTLLDFDDLESGGLMAGGQLGYLHQYHNNVVVGAEISGSYVGGDDSIADADPDTANGEVDWVGEARLRLGYAVYEGDTPILPYVTGGVAMAGYEAAITGGGATQNVDETAFGGVVGGGVEVMIDPSISAGVEGLYYFFEDDTAVNLAGAAAGDSIDLDGAWGLRAKLNYRF